MPKYTMITTNVVTATTRKTSTYFIRTEVVRKLPNINDLSEINDLRELELTRYADFVVRDGKLVKARYDVTGLLAKALLS